VVEIASCGVIVVLGSLSFVQAGRWKDTDTLYSYALNGTRSIHYIILGKYQDDLAKPWYRRALEAVSQHRPAQAMEFARQGDACTEKAMEYYRKATQLETTDTDGYDRWAKDLALLGRIPEAIEVVKQWMKVEPQVQPDAGPYGREKPGTLEAMLGMLYLQNGQYAEAVDMLKRSLALTSDPDEARAMAKTLERAQKFLAQAATRPGK
jgi:tetratricopeptide (TPR) repeat protein